VAPVGQLGGRGVPRIPDGALKPGAHHPDLLQCLDRSVPANSSRRHPSGTCAVAS
jgi:hypothetical protein